MDFSVNDSRHWLTYCSNCPLGLLSVTGGAVCDELYMGFQADATETYGQDVCIHN